MNRKAQPLPKSAFTLYVKLYCKKKATEHKGDKSLVGAAKSWLTLTESEKEQFYKKHKECQMKRVKRFADALKKVEPYLKEKPFRRNRNLVNSINSEESVDVGTDYNNSISSVKKHDNVEYNQECHIDQHKSAIEGNIPVTDDNVEAEAEQLEEEMDILEESTSLQENISKNKLPEPTPPTLKTGKDLFDMVKSMEEDQLSWIKLSQKQKSRYQSAVLFLKKDYIKKYKAYLESLTPKELFNYYNNCTLLDV